MIIMEFSKFNELIDIKPLNVDLMFKAFELHSIKHNIAFLSFDGFEDKCKKHCIREGFDPNTTTVLYNTPQDNQNEIPVEMDDSSYDTENIPLLNKTLRICMFYTDTTPQELADKINQITSLKAFL